ncbi:hypothetical protein [Melissococcus plutonius]|nr:hypothetical protein [Melissococcus plutonius]AKQ32818.1 hypothetical protein MEPL_178p000620 [Melissococcus plutonius S1]KMT23514.1 hypothetical protein MEPL2_5c00240 [Melissococcus plutonius]KMT23688.1 hypothetical protein MEPL3_9c00890 [Melissococcus plutonius]KMT23795.1 hypothetical protein MEPL1_11c00790 [Melissococcus plutonius]KMT28148.1 hypothetical protein MEPL4_7c01110 [Melissococcus plutonius]
MINRKDEVAELSLSVFIRYNPKILLRSANFTKIEYYFHSTP